MDDPFANPSDPTKLSDRELLIALYHRMEYLAAKAGEANHNGNSKLEHLAWASLGASGLAGMEATISLIAWGIWVIAR